MASQTPGGRLFVVDQLRGVAILLVLVYHAGPLDWRLPPTNPQGWLIWPALGWRWILVPFLHFGFTGVHAFFVLSGFCIHRREALLRAAGRTVPFLLRPYAARRFWRIYPPYWIALALFGIAAPLLLRMTGQTPTDLGLHALMLHGFVPSSIFSINPAFWSLCTEEQFYVTYPLIVLLSRRWSWARIAGAALALSLLWRAVVLWSVAPTVDHFLLYRVLLHGLWLPRWFEWLLGAWLAERAAGRGALPRWVSLVGVALFVLGMGCRVHVVVDKLLSDALFGAAFALWLGALLSRTKEGVLGRGLRFVGERAYGLYLIHQPLLDAPRSLLFRVVSAVGGGLLFSRFCEKPFADRASRVR